MEKVLIWSHWLWFFVPHGTVVWLRAELATLAERVGTDGGRPLLGDDPRAALARLGYGDAR